MLDETVQVVNLLMQYKNVIEEVTLPRDVYKAFIKEFSIGYENADKDWVIAYGIIVRRGI